MKKKLFLLLIVLLIILPITSARDLSSFPAYDYPIGNFPGFQDFSYKNVAKSETECSYLSSYGGIPESYCYYSAALYQNNVELCSKTSELKNRCIYDVAAQTKNLDYCYKIDSNPYDYKSKDNCIGKVAVLSLNRKLCDLTDKSLTGHGGKEECLKNIDERYKQLALEQNNPELCSKINIYSWYKDDCYTELAYKTKNSEYCNNIKDFGIKIKCYESLGNFTPNYILFLFKNEIIFLILPLILFLGLFVFKKTSFLKNNKKSLIFLLFCYILYIFYSIRLHESFGLYAPESINQLINYIPFTLLYILIICPIYLLIKIFIIYNDDISSFVKGAIIGFILSLPSLLGLLPTTQGVFTQSTPFLLFVSLSGMTKLYMIPFFIFILRSFIEFTVFSFLLMAIINTFAGAIVGLLHSKFVEERGMSKLLFWILFLIIYGALELFGFFIMAMAVSGA